MKTPKLYILFTLLLMIGIMKMQAQNHDWQTNS